MKAVGCGLAGVGDCWELVWWSCPLHTSQTSHYVAGVLVTTEKLDHCFRIVWITFSVPSDAYMHLSRTHSWPHCVGRIM